MVEMAESVMGQDAPNSTRRPAPTEAQRRQRKKNLVVMGILVAFVVLVYFIAIVRMSGG